METAEIGYKELKPWLTKETIRQIAAKHYPDMKQSEACRKVWEVIRKRVKGPEVMIEVIERATNLKKSYAEKEKAFRDANP